MKVKEGVKAAAAPGLKSAGTGLDAKQRDAVATGLVSALADTYTLMVKSHVYHWNVVGPLFKPLHELLEEHYTDLFEAVDELAERIRALDRVAPVSFAKLLAKADIAEETANRSAEDMIDQLVMDHEALCRSFRDLCGTAEEADDVVTADLLTGRLAFHEKAIWMLKATRGR